MGLLHRYYRFKTRYFLFELLSDIFHSYHKMIIAELGIGSESFGTKWQRSLRSGMTKNSRNEGYLASEKTKKGHANCNTNKPTDKVRLNDVQLT